MQSPTVPSLCAVAVAAGTPRMKAAAAVRSAFFKVMCLLHKSQIPRALVMQFRQGGCASAGRIAQAAQETGQAEFLVGAAPLSLPFLDLHHVVDPPIEEPGGLAPTLAIVVEPGQQRRGIDTV